MNTSNTARYAALTLVSLLFASPSISAQERPSLAHRDAKSAANLYLMRNLEHTLATWKTGSAEPMELGAWMEMTRIRLVRFQKLAENYELDPNVIRAYQDVQKLLDEYEIFVRDVVLFDLVANVARPEIRSYKAGVAQVTQAGLAGAEGGKILGGVAGTFALPVVGTIAGAKAGAIAGAVVGAAAGAVSFYFERQEAIEKNERIDAQVKAARLAMLTQLARHHRTTISGLRDTAVMLAGPGKYRWGDEVGFDDKSLSLQQQLQRRPNDSFLMVTMAVSEAGSNPVSAAEWMAKAAAAVPADFDEADIFDRDRAEFLLAAARLAERAARHSGYSSDAAKAVNYYRAACNCLKSRDQSFPIESRLVYARACALANLASEANTVLYQLQQYGANDPWICYECAAVKSMMSDTSSALEYLRRSFQTQPRWQPCVCKDSRFANLTSSRSEEVERICANPLIGEWTGNDLVIRFYPDGSVWQKSSRGTYGDGKFELLDGGKVRLSSPRGTAELSYTVTKNALKLIGNGYTYDLKRDRVSGLVGGRWIYNADHFWSFHDDGTWRCKNGATEVSGTYCVITGSDGHEVRYTRDDPVLGPIEKRIRVKVDGDKLQIQPWDESTWYKYDRSAW